VQRTGVIMTGDPRRVAARLFLPGQEPSAPGTSRAAGVVARCSAMSDEEVDATLAEIDRSYASRHCGLDALLRANFAAIAHRVPEAAGVSAGRRRLLGAYFTREISIEAAALFNPSVVAHPAPGLTPGSLRFLMSARAVSEGHLSTVVFRAGSFEPDEGPDGVRMDPPPRFVAAAKRGSASVPRERLRQQAAADGAEPETLGFVLSRLPDAVDLAALDEATDALRRESLTWTDVEVTIELLRRTVTSTYQVSFAAESNLSERTLFPEVDDESHGMEDARFVRLVEDDGSSSYAATYTGFNGSAVVSRRLDTDDFRTFRSTPLTGRAADNKGMALFPRRVGGRYLALSRWDRENNAVASSADGYQWNDVAELQTPAETWELIQLGNCGPPLETEIGWLVLTHGVGPMRAYALGALLLDLEDPTRVVGRLPEPLLRPQGAERDGYVPNVVYSCGGLIHQQKLLLPYGCSDTSIRVAVVDVPQLLERLVAG
jgi:predicted GH43/DUF377 family glycosyl hydrolase